MNRRSTRTALVTTAVAAAGAGLVFLTSPAIANGAAERFGAGPTPRTTTSVTCPMDDTGYGGGSDADDSTSGRYGMGYGMGYGMWGGTVNGGTVNGGMMNRRGAGPVGDVGANRPAAGTLTAAQKSTLAAMAEEEKLAHDVYTTLAKSSGDVRFAMVARSESRHLEAVRVLLDRYDVADPTAGTADGVFPTASVQSSYDSLVAKGTASLDAALGAGRQIETADIADLKKAMTGLDAADVTTVYQRLSAASEHHLAAFGG